MAILRRTERAMMRTMCEVKIIEKRRNQELELAGFKGYFGCTVQDEWSAMVWACFEKSVEF